MVIESVMQIEAVIIQKKWNEIICPKTKTIQMIGVAYKAVQKTHESILAPVFDSSFSSSFFASTSPALAAASRAFLDSSLS